MKDRLKAAREQLQGFRQVAISTDGTYRCCIRGCWQSEVMIWERCDGGDCKFICGRHYDGSGLCFFCQSTFTRAKHGREFRCESCGGERKRRSETCYFQGCKNKAKLRGMCMTHHKLRFNGCDICFTDGVALTGIPKRYVTNACWDAREVYPMANLSKHTIYPCRVCINRFFKRCDRRLCSDPATEVDYKCKYHSRHAAKKRKTCAKCGTKPPAKARKVCHACHKKRVRLAKCCDDCQQRGKKKGGCKDCKAKAISNK